MKKITKIVKTMKCDWKVGEESKTANVNNVEVRVMTPEPEDIEKWVLDADRARLEQVCYLIGSQLLQHQGSTAFRAEATKKAKGAAHELDTMVFEYDFTRKVGERGEVNTQSLKEKTAKFLGIPVEMLTDELFAKLQKVAQGKSEDISDTEEADESVE